MGREHGRLGTGHRTRHFHIATPSDNFPPLGIISQALGDSPTVYDIFPAQDHWLSAGRFSQCGMCPADGIFSRNRRIFSHAAWEDCPSARGYCPSGWDIIPAPRLQMRPRCLPARVEFDGTIGYRSIHETPQLTSHTPQQSSKEETTQTLKRIGPLNFFCCLQVEISL